VQKVVTLKSPVLTIFSLYINDLNNAVNYQPRLFAVDTSLIDRAPNPLIFQHYIEKELEKLHNWCCANKLTIHPNKSNVLIILPKLKNIDNFQLIINCARTPIHIVENAKYLGVIIDNRLEFQQHIRTIEGKLVHTVGTLYKLKISFHNL